MHFTFQDDRNCIRFSRAFVYTCLPVREVRGSVLFNAVSPAQGLLRAPYILATQVELGHRDASDCAGTRSCLQRFLRCTGGSALALNGPKLHCRGSFSLPATSQHVTSSSPPPSISYF